MTNTPGGMVSPYDVEFYCYERLPYSWRLWLCEHEFNMSVGSTYAMYEAGVSLADVKLMTLMSVAMYKKRMGWVSGHNGCASE